MHQQDILVGIGAQPRIGRRGEVHRDPARALVVHHQSHAEREVGELRQDRPQVGCVGRVVHGWHREAGGEDVVRAGGGARGEDGGNRPGFVAVEDGVCGLERGWEGRWGHWGHRGGECFGRRLFGWGRG